MEEFKLLRVSLGVREERLRWVGHVQKRSTEYTR